MGQSRVIPLAVEAADRVGAGICSVVSRFGAFVAQFLFSAEFRTMAKYEAGWTLSWFLLVGVNPGRQVIMVAKFHRGRRSLSAEGENNCFCLLALSINDSMCI